MAIMPLSLNWASSTPPGHPGLASVKLDATGLLRGSRPLRPRKQRFAANTIGIAYMDDCLILGLNYSTGYSYGTGVAVLNHTVTLQLALRTLGTTSVGTGVGGTNGL